MTSAFFGVTALFVAWALLLVWSLICVIVVFFVHEGVLSVRNAIVIQILFYNFFVVKSIEKINFNIFYIDFLIYT